MITKLQEHKKAMILVSMILFLWIGFCFLQSEEEIEEPVLETTEPVEERQETIQVDIKGAVQKPGVYELETNARVEDAIKKSGGLLENADITTINLSKKLEDEMVIIIYTQEEITAFKEEEQRQNKVETTCICPKIENHASIQNPTTNYQTEASTNSKQVSLNQGTVEDFKSLSGIGESKAQAIVQYREEHGPFQTIEDIKNVSGIGDATFEKIKQYLTL